MALEYIAVEGLTISHSIGSPISGGSFSITSIPSIKVKVEGKGVYTLQLSFTFSGGSISGGVPGSVTGTGTISTTALKVRAEGNIVLREGDTGTMSGTYQQTNPSPPPPTITIPFSGAGVEITTAGQIKVKVQ